MCRLPSGKLAAAISSLAVAAVAAGCAHPAVVGGDRTLQIALSEYRLNPQDVRARAGSLTIVARNYGRLTHDLVVSRGGQSAGATKPIAPGRSARITLTLPAGTYVLASTLLSDEALGEYGTLTVTP